MSQGELFTDSSEDLPPQARFPINGYGRHVEEPVKQELSASRDPLIITGYTSLTMMVDFLASCRESQTPYTSIRILLGHEPIASPQYEFRSSRHHFSQEVNDYWLERGISITLCAKVLAAIEVIDKGNLSCVSGFCGSGAQSSLW